jgi:hypothetical protein
MINVRWLDEQQKVLYAEFSGELTWQEFASWDPQVRRMLESGEHPVDGIIDMSRVTRFPKDYAQIVQSGHIEFPPRLRLVIIVGNRFAYDCMVATEDLRTDDRFPYRYAETVTDAHALIAAEQGGQSTPSAPPDRVFLN